MMGHMTAAIIIIFAVLAVVSAGAFGFVIGRYTDIKPWDL